MEAIVDDNVNVEDLKKFEKIYHDQLSRGGEPSSKATFEYAFCLVRSKSTDCRLGIRLLEELLNSGDFDTAKRDYLYYLAIGYTRMKEYDKALKYIDALLRAEETNQQAISLRALIVSRMKRDAAIGAAVVGGAAMVGGLALVAGVFGLAKLARK